MANIDTFGTDSGVGSTIALLESKLPGVRERRRQLEGELATVVAQEDAMVSALQGLAALSAASLEGASPATQDATPVASAVTPAPPAPAVAKVSAESVADGPVDEQPASSPEPAVAQPGRKRTTSSAAGRAATVKKVPAKKAIVRKATSTKGTPGKGTASGKGAPAGPVAEAASAVVSSAVVAEAPAEAGVGASSAGSAPKATVKRTTSKKAAAKEGAGAKKATAKKAVSSTGKAAAAETAPAPSASSGRRRLAQAESVVEILARATGPLRAREVTGLLGLDDQDTSNVNAVRTMLERLAKADRAQRSGRGLYVASAGLTS
ncbi:hypothetical protein OG689_39210 [Kitasatospora sp. NBC_00240]|uniref:hypothetical protein n=1 Tax=Kitasatospora sp. NBC_00240 TaxID=2903567 RepID=UPI002255B698|nr:hypothetical protein [Kitasatospora sp. NBC_00240]MCX5215224.1 hypothetical protein [Kitasatospora sp. NBC_00240]